MFQKIIDLIDNSDQLIRSHLDANSENHLEIQNKLILADILNQKQIAIKPDEMAWLNRVLLVFSGIIGLSFINLDKHFSYFSSVLVFFGVCILYILTLNYFLSVRNSYFQIQRKINLLTREIENTSNPGDPFLWDITTFWHTGPFKSILLRIVLLFSFFIVTFWRFKYIADKKLVYHITFLFNGYSVFIAFVLSLVTFYWRDIKNLKPSGVSRREYFSR